MKVLELIELLATCNGDWEVMIDTGYPPVGESQYFQDHGRSGRNAWSFNCFDAEVIPGVALLEL